MARLEFASDYMEGCIPEILTRLTETNLEKSSGYGSDEHTARAAELIREACDAPDAEVHLLAGGTQTNRTVIGARLAYGLGATKTDLTLADIARTCDAFYIGGTKCGALFGEAVVFPKPNTCPRFFTWMKQQGALLAKGRITGLQFETLMEENRYVEYGAKAVRLAEKLREGLKEKGYQLLFNSTTNQTFIKLPDDKYQTLSEKVGMSFWEKPDDNHTIVRLATSWATTEEDVDALLALM